MPRLIPITPRVPSLTLSLRLFAIKRLALLDQMGRPVLLIARHHHSGTGTFTFGKVTGGSHANVKLLYLPSDNWAVEVCLVESVLDTAPPGTSTVARLEIDAGTDRTSLRRTACLQGPPGRGLLASPVRQNFSSSLRHSSVERESEARRAMPAGPN